MKSRKRLGFIAITLLTAGYIGASPAARAAYPPSGDSEEVTQLLLDAKAEAIELEHDAMRMETFTRNPVSWHSHTNQITLIREHVNKTAKLLTKLHEARGTASPWQQKAIDQIHPLLKQLAANTRAAIEHLNNTQNVDLASEYHSYLKANLNAAEKLATLIADFIDYDEAVEKLEGLNQKLAVAEN